MTKSKKNQKKPSTCLSIPMLPGLSGFRFGIFWRKETVLISKWANQEKNEILVHVATVS
jgi:hypothetical protein